MAAVLNWLISMARESIIDSMQGLLQCFMRESGVLYKRSVGFK